MQHPGLLASALVLCTSAMFAQGQANPDQSPVVQPTTQVTSSNGEPWRIIPKVAQEPSDAGVRAEHEHSLNILDSNAPLLRSDLNSPLLTAPARSDEARSDEQRAEMARQRICYSIRSYLMARDSKDSDSTHLVGVSTCQPAQQYGLKTTDLKPRPVQP